MNRARTIAISVLAILAATMGCFAPARARKPRAQAPQDNDQTLRAMRDEMARSKTRLELKIPGTEPAGAALLRGIPAARPGRERDRRAIRHADDQHAYAQPVHGRGSARGHLQAGQLELHRRRGISRIHRVHRLGGNRPRLRFAAAGSVDCHGPGLQGSGGDVLAQAGIFEQPGAAIGHRRFFEGRAGARDRSAGHPGLDAAAIGSRKPANRRQRCALSRKFTKRA